MLYVPDFRFDLFLVSKLIKELRYCGIFFLDFCVLQGLYNRKMMRIGKENSGLYVLQWKDIPTATVVTKDVDESTPWHVS